MVAIMAKVREWLSKALALLDYIISILRVKLSFLKRISPTDAPKYWIYINGMCCVVTAMFFLLGCMQQKSFGYQMCETYYIPFNLVICFIWFLEAGLWMLFDEESEAWHKLFEVGLAVFFVLDSVIWLYGHWFLQEELKTGEILLYSAIDFFIYLFYLVLAIRSEAKLEMEEAQALARGNDTGGGIKQASGDAESGRSAVVPPSSDQQQEATTDFKLLT